MRSIFFKLMIALSLSSAVSVALANPVIPVPTQPEQPSFTPDAPNLNVKAYILMDATSGKILAENHADDRLPPASLTKLMSLYIVSNAIQNKQIGLDDKVRISVKAWRTGGSRMFVKAADEVPVKELLQGVIVDSGNDATVALAEYVGGSEESFTNMMNQQADRLGMTNSHFTDSTGLPNEAHYASAHDLATLASAYIKNYPDDYHFYSQKWFTYNGIKQPNRNRLLWRYNSADGVKTGHTSEAGYCLIGSAKQNNMRLITVILGAPSDIARSDDSVRLLTYGFRFFQTNKLYNGETELTKADVWKGAHAEIPLGLTEDLYVTVPKGQYDKLKPVIELTGPLKAPIKKNDVYGKLLVKLNDQVIAEKPLVALSDDPIGGLFRRTADAVKLRFSRLFAKNKTVVDAS